MVKELPSAKGLDVPTINDEVPLLLKELALALEVADKELITEVMEDGSPTEHGEQRAYNGYDIVEVITEYNILRGCIHDLAESNGILPTGRTFHILNHTFDQAIGLAMTSYVAWREQETHDRRQEYLAFVTHDLRTPLNAIRMAVDLLDQVLPSAAREVETDQLLKAIHRNSTHMSNLVERIMEESTHSEPAQGVQVEKRFFDLWPVVGSVVRSLEVIAETQGTTLVNKVPVDLVAYADAQLLWRVFQNVIRNAITYAPAGEVRIEASAGLNGSVECCVIDNGVGIPADRLPHIFVKGVGDPSKEESSGLGLAIVKTFIEAHGGTVEASSGGKGGTTIRFALPGKPT